jgi:pimeloyl-ACP methyl ester carboxylesterase
MTANIEAQGNYADVNGLRMYYEIHGEGRPLVLIHGAFATISMFGELLTRLAQNHRVIAIEQQGHGHTALTDREMTYELMTEDNVALLRHLGIEGADVVGYSMGSAMAMLMASRHPELVRKLVLISPSISPEGIHPGILEGIEHITPEVFAGTPLEEAYMSAAPRPEDWPRLIAKVKKLDTNYVGWPPEVMRQIEAPTMIMIGDSDITTPEHAVEMFRLVGGGVAGDVVGLPKSQLAILPGTTHVSVMFKFDWVTSMIEEFLEAPVPEEGAAPHVPSLNESMAG